MSPRAHTRADPENLEYLVKALPRKAFGLSGYLESLCANPESPSFGTSFARELCLCGELTNAFAIPAYV